MNPNHLRILSEVTGRTTENLNERLPLEIITPTQALAALEMLQGEMESNKWISVDERLPEDGQSVNAYREDAGVFECMYGSAEGSFTDEDMKYLYKNGLTEDMAWEKHFWFYTVRGVEILHDDLIPTHWRPLPTEPTK